MKKIIFLVIFLPVVAFSQTAFNIFSDSAETNIINNNDTIVIVGDSANQVTYDFFSYIKNNTTNSMNLHIEMQKIYVSENNLLQLCYGGVCYNSLYCDAAINPNTSEELHISLYYTSSDTQANIIKVSIYNQTKGDTSVFFVKYKKSATASFMNPFVNSFKISKPYPNPADKFVKFDFYNTKPGENHITFYSILGDKITSKEIEGNRGTIIINTSNFKTGYYIYTVTLDGKKVKTDRCLIRH